MTTLSKQRCYNHMGREAVARCPECGRFYCRECVTSHEGRALCASCLSRTAAADQAGAGALRNLLHVLAGPLKWLAGICAAWLAFYLLAQGLLAIPTDYHDGTIFHEKTAE
jgi:hypothetical protein